MGYFPNGTDGMRYEDQYCSRCIHGPDNVPEGQGCAVWDAHFLFNYDQHGDKPIRDCLSLLIPMDRDGRNQQCKMFVEAK